LFLLIFWIPVFTVMLYMSGIMPLTALLAIGVFIGGGTANRIEILYFENVFDFIPAPKRMVSSIGDNLAWLGQIVMYVAEVFQLISFTLKLIKSPDLITMIDLGITVLIIALLTAFAVKVAKRCLFRDHPNKTPHQSAGTLANKQAA